MTIGQDPIDGLNPSEVDIVRGELYRARYLLVGEGFNRVSEAINLDEQGGPYFHVLFADDAEMPVFLRDQTFAPENYSMIMLGNYDVGIRDSEEAEVNLLVMIPDEFFIGDNGFDGLPESHQHLIIHRYVEGKRVQVIKAGVEGVQEHYWDLYQKRSRELQSSEFDPLANTGLVRVPLIADLDLIEDGAKPLTAYDRLADADPEMMRFELDRLRRLHRKMEDYIILPQRRRTISTEHPFNSGEQIDK